MNAGGIEAAVHAEFDRQAAGSPAALDAAGLLAAVHARRRRRHVRIRVVSAAAAALAVAVVLGVVQVLRAATDRPGGTDVAAVPHAPGVFAADEITLCLDYTGDRLAEVLLAARTGGDRFETAATDPDGDQRFGLHTERADTYTLRLDVVRGPLAAQRLTGPRGVRYAERDGRVGDDPGSGDRALYLETGIADSILRLGVAGTGPTDGQLVGWAGRITIDTDRTACGS